jgi:hypothetical protein
VSPVLFLLEYEITLVTAVKMPQFGIALLDLLKKMEDGFAV